MEKKKLRRRCEGGCGRILDVNKMEDSDSDEIYNNTVRWVADPFVEEIYNEYIYMWLCGICYQEHLDEI